MNYYFMVQHGQIEKELCQVKDTKQKRNRTNRKLDEEEMWKDSI